MLNLKKKLLEKKAVSLLMVVIGMVIFSTFAMSATALMLQLQQNTVLTSDRLEEMSIAYDGWNKIVSEDFDSLLERIATLSGRTEVKTVASKYQLSITYGTEGVFLNGDCESGTATDDQQRCLPVTISITNPTSATEKPYALSTTKVASKGSSGSKGLDWSKVVSFGASASGTVPEDGVLFVSFGGSGHNTGSEVSINGVSALYMYDSYAGWVTQNTIVSKGDVWQWTNCGSGGLNNIWFVPYKK